MEFAITPVLGLLVMGVIEIFKPGIELYLPDTRQRTIIIRLAAFLIGVIVLALQPELLASDPLLSFFPPAVAIVLGAGSVVLFSGLTNTGANVVKAVQHRIETGTAAIKAGQPDTAVTVNTGDAQAGVEQMAAQISANLKEGTYTDRASPHSPSGADG